MFQSSIHNVLGFVVSASALCLACGGESPPEPKTAFDLPASEQPTDRSPSPSAASSAPAPQSDVATGTEPGASLAPTSGNQVTPSSPSPQPSAPALSQGQVAMMADLANASEVEQGKLAQTKAKATRVKKFAGMMVKHHGEARLQQAKLFKELNITPTQSQPATELKESADKTLGSLRAATGSEFDVAYIDSQVAAHEKVLEAIDRQLLPAATDEQLVSELKKMRSTVEGHLTEAKSIQAELLESARDRSAAAR